MAQIANLIAYDGAATPVLHTLKPASPAVSENGEWTVHYLEDVAGVPSYANVWLRAKKKVLPSGVTRVTIRIGVPVMESVSGQNSAGYTAAPLVAFTDEGEFVFYAHPRSTTESHRRLRQIMVNLLGGVTTSVAPVTTGQLQELVDSLFMPN